MYAQGLSTPRRDAKWAHGGDPDEVRSKLARIKMKCPESTFVRYLDYWEAFEGLSTKDAQDLEQAISAALHFAQLHATFPLTDELLVRTAHRLIKLERIEEARQVVQRLEADHKATDLIEEFAKLKREFHESELRQEEARRKDETPTAAQPDQ
jgi:hypothetical protein